MEALPSPSQLSGKHNAVFEAYYKQMDPKCAGAIEAMEAAKFLKKSGLSDVVLSRIWDLSDPNGRGYLDKSGFFVALKLVSLAQAGSDINMRNILVDCINAPKVGPVPKTLTQTIQNVSPVKGDWSIKPLDVVKYEQLFDSLQPVNGMIAGNKVKGVLIDSKLPLETLGKIWDLADQDKDGNLDRHEFIVAMHLVYQALDKRIVPTSLPVELQNKQTGTKKQSSEGAIEDSFENSGFIANFPKDIDPPTVPPISAPLNSSIQALPTKINPPITLMSTDPIISTNRDTYAMAGVSDWVVTPSDKARYDIIFRESDSDMDGLVSGLEVKNIFLQSGVTQNCLAHIWALCDTNQTGKLTLEQFALAMWFVEQKKRGIEPPEVLTYNMIPPSLRGSALDLPLIEKTDVKPAYFNPELQMISKEIDELTRERRMLEAEIAQTDADIRIKTGEVHSLQSELDTLVATLKQLENQKGEAQKRLDDLTAQVNKIREQCQMQEATVTEQQEDLDFKRSELQKLKNEENALEKEYEVNRLELDNLTKQLQDTQLQIRQVKAMVTKLLETQRQMTDGLILCKAAIEVNDCTLVSDYSLNIETQFDEAKQKLEKQSISTMENCFVDVLRSKDATTWETDAFTSANEAKNITGFDEHFSGSTVSGFDDDFDSSAYGIHELKHPFVESTADPFGDKNINAVAPVSGAMDFGSDPFAILHAPTSTEQALSSSFGQKVGPPLRPESPSPALPPKKSKQPPPRPAPPRQLQHTKTLPTSVSMLKIEKTKDTKTSTYDPKLLAKGRINNSLSDFCDDPFKDYRYEDPFHINDPFDDETEDKINSEDNSNKITSTSQFHTGAKEMLDKNKLSSNFTARPSTRENFAVFNLEKTLQNKNINNLHHAFDDNFDSFNNGRLQSNVDSCWDPFGVDETTTNKKETDFTDAFNDNFEDHLKLRVSNVNEADDMTNENFACFDSFDETAAAFSNKVLNNSKSSIAVENEVPKIFTNSSIEKFSEKFGGDYSKDDNYNKDLQKVLERSLVDQ